MSDGVASPTRSPSASRGIGAATGVGGGPSLRQRPISRAATFNDLPAPRDRRPSSMLSDFSLEDARNSFRSSTDDLLLPKAHGTRPDTSHEPSVWHSSPLAFALLPAVGGLIFTNGSAVITDVTLLGLAAVFLNWSVRLPWDWYYSAQSVATLPSYPADAYIDESEGDAEGDLDGAEDGEVDLTSRAEESMSAEDLANSKRSSHPHHHEAKDAAAHELRTHELLALASCFLFPLFGAYLLHTIRAQLSRPSEGLVSDYNLTIFVLAAEIRPLAHLIKIIQARTLFLQRLVNASPYSDSGPDRGVTDLGKRVQEIEARLAVDAASPTTTGGAGDNKSAVTVTTEVRRTLQPDLDALNRAVRRYEKRATMQTMQTEARLLDLEARLADALSLAAAAAQSGQRQRHGLGSLVWDGVFAMVVLPLQALWSLVNLPMTALLTLLSVFSTASESKKPGRERKRHGTHGRLGGDRIQARGLKKS
ncbi:MAG: hypothetical protein M1838_006241 [Thelocarpon superellum]|nr:MAG: hypothetical protein M1838_006241 [Thelocarpon superellum]